MTIALAHYSSNADISGVTSWFVRFVLRLQSDGYDPVVHLHHFGWRPSEGTVVPQLRDAGVAVQTVVRGPTLRHDVAKTLKFLDDTRPSLFLPQCLTAHCVAAAIAGKKGLPWAFTVHSDDPDYWEQLEEVVPEATMGRTVCVSSHIASKVTSRQLDHRPITIPYGVEIPPLSTVSGDNEFRVAFIGRLVERQKRMSLVMEALVRACRAHPGIKGYVIGDGPERAECERIVRDAGLGHRILLVGRVPPEEIGRHLAQMHACLLMSDFEGLPLALLESMAAGVVPVVRSIDSGIPELVFHEGTGLLVNEDPSSAAAALTRLAQDAELWSRCSYGARQLVINAYSADGSYRRWTELISEMQLDTSAVFPLEMARSMQLVLRNPDLETKYGNAQPWWHRVGWHAKRLLLGTPDDRPLGFN
jgi:colanic acid/amylovoran biosynthesis glycosyltransferase